MARKVAEILNDQSGELGIEFNRIYPPCAVIQRRKHIGAAARTKHKCRRTVEQVERQGRCLLVEISKCRKVAVKTGDDRQPLAIGEDA